ncbi:MAG: hypothetical protein AB7I37_04855 [Pirellulales bacterium]
MEATAEQLALEKSKLMDRLVEIEVEEQRRNGLIKSVPRFSEIEDAGRSLGHLLTGSASRCWRANTSGVPQVRQGL